MPQLFTKDSRQRGLAFRPRPTDVIISPYTKSGTTWLQHIAHGLQSGGSMDFEEISVVTPWLEVAWDLGWDLDADQVAEPRVFKSHVSWHDIPKGARYICSFRDPADVCVSFYRFFEGFMFEPGAIDIENFSRWRSPREKMGEQGYWFHLLSWWEQRSNPDVLLLCYEDMKEDLPGTVRRIASFMGIGMDESLLELVVHQSSRAFMLEHAYRFNEAPLRRRAEKLRLLPFDVDALKVTPGATNVARHRLTKDLERELTDIWQERVQTVTGLASYDALRRAVGGLYPEAA
ncbi:MAG: sulfotransferase domain-containing protein [Trueperaceae bacterium]